MSYNSSYMSFEQAVSAELERVLSMESGGSAVSAESVAPCGCPFPAVASCEAGGCGIWSLASGSRANCTLISTGKRRILVDFGLSCRMAKKLLSELSVNIADIDAVFITHEHSDHVSGLATLFKNYGIPVHMTEPTFLAYTRGRGFDFRDRITVHPLEYEVELGGVTVRSHPVSHDSAACVAYSVRGDGVSFCICTDLGYMSEGAFEALACSRDVIIESNHDLAMLKYGTYPEELKRRILSRSGHLSNADCGAVLVKLASLGVKRALLAHVSPENNTPELALQSAIEALEKGGQSLEYLAVAPRLSPIRLV